MTDGVTREARSEELAELWPEVRSLGVVDSLADFEALFEAAPWRVRVGRRDEFALLGRWREHLDLASVQGLWCAPKRIAPILGDLAGVAHEHGFHQILGPVVAEAEASPYAVAGMDVRERLVVYHRRTARVAGSHRAPSPPPAGGMRPPSEASSSDADIIRPAGPGDLDAVIDVDRECFDEFWRYDPDWLRRVADAERLAVAERRGRVIGYTLCTVRCVEATVGRLAVRTAERGAGVGAALLEEAVAYAASSGAAAVSLCTQEHNQVSRRLYGRAGFREIPGQLVMTLSAPWHP